MYHFQVGSMGARLLLFYVIYQTAITTALGGVTLPFTDLVGKVTPVKPKPLSPSTIASLSSSPITKSSLIWEGEDIMPKLFSPVAGGSVYREFSSPLVFTSSSRALPIPKIDSSSILDVKLPERLREKFLPPKVKPSQVYPNICNVPVVNNAVKDIRIPEVTLPYKHPFAPSTKLPNALPYSSLDVYLSPFNKLPPLPSINSLPTVPLESLKRNDFDMLGSASKSNNIFAPAPRSRTLDSPLSLEARKPTFSAEFTPNNLFPLCSSYSLPYPLYYKSMYLPRVRTPEMLPLNYKPIPYTGTGHLNFPSQSSSQNLISPMVFSSDKNLSSFSGRYSTLPYLNPIKISESSKPLNMIQVPKISSNVPFSPKPTFFPQNTSVKNLWFPESESCTASIPFQSNFAPSESTFNLKPLIISTIADKITADCTHTPPCLTKICPAIKPFTPITPLSYFPNQPASFDLDVIPNCISNFEIKKDCSRIFDLPDVFPIVDAYVDSMGKINMNDFTKNDNKIRVDFNDVPILKQINLPCSLIPEVTYNQCPLYTEECVYVSNSQNLSPPVIPYEPIATITSKNFSPTSYSPSRISQTPITPASYLNVSPPSSVTQSTTNMVSSINDMVSNIAKNILSSFKCHINSASQNISQNLKCALKSNPYINSGLKLVSLPTVNPVNTKSVLPIISSPIDCINSPAIASPTVISLEAPCKLIAYETSSSQTSPICLSLLLSPLINLPSPPLCPSYLPLPNIPSYPTIASPFYMDAPVFKISSSKKNSELEKLLELMLIAEILNNDDSFDWDDLDTLLALLSVK